jgi:hypothetical protein
LNNRQQETGARLLLLLLAACWSNQNLEFQDPFDFRFDLVIRHQASQALSWNSPEMFIPA